MAESLFIQSGFVYRAIEMNMELFQWERLACDVIADVMINVHKIDMVTFICT